MIHINLENEVAIVTGGAAGIGLATVKLLAEAGAKVGIIDIDEINGKNLEKELKSKNRDVYFIKGTTGEEESISRCINTIGEKYGTISILINGATTCIMKSIEATMQDWIEMIKTGVAGYALCAKYALPFMKKNKQGGVIVNICSISAMIAQESFVTYSAVKGAVLSMTRCMALDLAPFGIRVNSISPGTTWTESNSKVIFKQTGLDLNGANQNEKIGGTHMLHRVGQPFEIANSILYLCSHLSSFMTGGNLVVDGGYTAK